MYQAFSSDALVNVSSISNMVCQAFSNIQAMRLSMYQAFSSDALVNASSLALVNVSIGVFCFSSDALVNVSNRFKYSSLVNHVSMKRALYRSKMIFVATSHN